MEPARLGERPSLVPGVIHAQVASADMSVPTTDQHHVSVLHYDARVMTETRRVGNSELLPDPCLGIKTVETIERRRAVRLVYATVDEQMSVNDAADVIGQCRTARGDDSPVDERGTVVFPARGRTGHVF